MLLQSSIVQGKQITLEHKKMGLSISFNNKIRVGSVIELYSLSVSGKKI